MDWIYSSSDPIIVTLVGCVIIFLMTILITRVVGLRSFAKFTNYDFAMTIAIGSIIASVLTSSTSLVHGFVAMSGLLLLTYLFSIIQRNSSLVDKIISNQPLLLMDGSMMLHDNLQKARIQESQVIAKLREANVLNFDQVVAVVLESTGDISVLHQSSSSPVDVDNRLLQNVKS